MFFQIKITQQASRSDMKNQINPVKFIRKLLNNLIYDNHNLWNEIKNRERKRKKKNCMLTLCLARTINDDQI